MKTKAEAFNVDESTELVPVESEDQLPATVEGDQIITHGEVRRNALKAQESLLDGLDIMKETLQAAGATYKTLPEKASILDGMAKIYKTMTDGAKAVADLHNIVKTDVNKPRPIVDNGNGVPDADTAGAVLMGGAAMMNIIKTHQTSNPATVDFDDEDDAIDGSAE